MVPLTGQRLHDSVSGLHHLVSHCIDLCDAFVNRLGNGAMTCIVLPDGVPGN